MTSSLFREQAINHQKGSIAGTVIVTPSSANSFIIISIFAWCIATLFWGFTSEYTETKKVQGWLQPSAGVVDVFPNSHSGQITEIFVSENETIVKGQNLLKINSERFLDNGNSFESEILREYKKQIALLKDREKQVKKDSEIETKRTQLKKESKKENLDRINEKIKLLKQRILLAEENYSKASSLYRRSLIPSSALDKALAEKLLVETELLDLERQSIELNEIIAMLEIQEEAVPANLEKELNLIKRAISEINLKIVPLLGSDGEVLTSPITGKISNVLVKTGMQLNNNSPLLTIVPENSQLEAVLVIPVSKSGLTEVGQSIELKYDAYPFQKYGTFTGSIVSISDSALLPHELEKSPFPTLEPVYRVRAEISLISKSDERQITFKPGMTFSANIAVSKRTIFEWVFEPLIRITYGI